MKLFYLNLNPEHSIGEQSIYDYNKDNVEWYSTPHATFPQWTGIAHLWYDFPLYSMHMSVDEIGKPIFDYYRKHGRFDRDEIRKMYYPQQPELNHIDETIANMDKNIAYVRDLKPDVIFIRFYFGYEFLTYYFLKAISQDFDCKIVLGGNVIDYADPYYLDIFFEEGLLDNYHFGFGEKHLESILNGEALPQRTSDLDLLIDDYTIPRAETHWVKTTLLCNGGCRFCALTHNAPKCNVDLTSEAYLDWLMKRMQYLESQGVTHLINPGSITFFNKAHIHAFYKKYKEYGLTISFIDSFFKFLDFDEQIVFMLQDMNFYSIKIGLESINPEIRKLIGKPFTTELVNQTLENLRKVDIKFKLSTLFNTPYDTLATTKETIGYLAHKEVKYSVLNRFYMVKDTDMYDNFTLHNLSKITNDHGYIVFDRIECEPEYNAGMKELQAQFYANNNKDYRAEYLRYTDKVFRL